MYFFYYHYIAILQKILWFKYVHHNSKGCVFLQRFLSMVTFLLFFPLLKLPRKKGQGQSPHRKVLTIWTPSQFSPKKVMQK